MSNRSLDNLTWEKIYQFLKRTPGIYVGNEQKCYTFVESIYWIMRTGAQWRDLPSSFGKWNSIYHRYAAWSDKQIWQKMHEFFVKEPDMEWLLLDSTVVRAHPCAAGAPEKKGGQAAQALGRSRGGFSTKVHVAVDGLGNPLRFLLTGGQSGDSPQAIPLLEGFDYKGVMADRGYDSDQILAYIEQQGVKAVIPAKKSRKVPRDTDWHCYKDRHLVECFINKIKHYRRLFTRFEKYDSRYLSFLSFAAALIWLK